MGSYPSVEKRSVYSTAPADWATGHSLGRYYPSAEMQSVYYTAPANWATIAGGRIVYLIRSFSLMAYQTLMVI